MNITGPIRQLLTANAPFTALVGTKVFADIIEQRTEMPAVVVRVIDILPSTFKNGVATVDTVILQVDVYAKAGSTSGMQQVETISEAARTVLDRYAGTVTVSGTPYIIQGCHFSGIAPLPFDIEDDVYRRASQYKIRYVR